MRESLRLGCHAVDGELCAPWGSFQNVQFCIYQRQHPTSPLASTERVLSSNANRLRFKGVERRPSPPPQDTAWDLCSGPFREGSKTGEILLCSEPVNQAPLRPSWRSLSTWPLSPRRLRRGGEAGDPCRPLFLLAQKLRPRGALHIYEWLKNGAVPRAAPWKEPVLMEAGKEWKGEVLCAFFFRERGKYREALLWSHTASCSDGGGHCVHSVFNSDTTEKTLISDVLLSDFVCFGVSERTFQTDYFH